MTFKNNGLDIIGTPKRIERNRNRRTIAWPKPLRSLGATAMSGVLFRAAVLATTEIGPPEGIERLGWHVRLGRTCGKGREYYPEKETSFEVDLIFKRQDNLE